MSVSVDRTRWAKQVVAGVAEPTAYIAALVADAVGADPTALGIDSNPPPPAGLVLPDPPAGWADPWLVGAVHEQAVGEQQRRGRGAWYTPEDVVRGLVSITIEVTAPLPELVVDPTCGGGAFLLAAADRLVELGLDPADALGQLAGRDIDPGAVMASRWSLGLWAAAHGCTDGDGRGPDVEVGDAIETWPDRWPQPRVVVGNPPFASPLRRGTIPPSADRYRHRRADLLGPYADLAAIHLVRTLDACGPGSRVLLVQPQSVLAGQDTEGLRTWVRSGPEGKGPVRLAGLWVAREAVFDASVRACAPLFTIGDPQPDSETERGPEVAEPDRTTVDLWSAPTVQPQGATQPGPWGRMAARCLGGPETPEWMDRPEAPTIGDEAEATAGFRDEYYGLVAACREAEGATPGRGERPVLTVGLVDPLTSWWGEASCRFGGKTWRHPVVSPADLEPKVGRWVDRQARPKIILATQSRVLEPLIDRGGSLIPATPLISVHAPPDRLNHLAAVLLAPPVVAWAWSRWFGSALAVDALKLAARQVLNLPLPIDEARWDQSAALVGEHDGHEGGDGLKAAIEVARTMTEAYEADVDVFDWWLSRARPRRARH